MFRIRKYLSPDNRGNILFSAGIIICMVLWSAVVWADFEASLFASSLPADKHISTLKCPVVVARNEMGNISVQFRNTIDRKLNTNIRTYISQGFVSFFGEFDTALALEPGEVRKLEWQVDSESAVWDRLIMVRIYSFRQYPFPSYTSTCGILVTGELPFSAGILFAGILFSGAAALISGAYLLGKQKSRSTTARSGIFASLISLVIMVFTGMFLGLLGSWLPSALLLVLALLLLIVAIATRLLES
jgi:hypothetical protein